MCFVSGRTGAGVAELLDVIVKLLPNPTESNPPDFLEGEGESAVAMHADPQPDKHVLAHVFKVTVDPYVGRMGIFRVWQGTVTKDSQLYIGDGRKPFKVGHLFMLQGKDHVEVDAAVPGDICAVAKVDDIAFDAVLHDAAEDDHIHLKPLPFPTPVHGLAIRPKRHGDEQRMWEILGKLVDEDPCLKIEHVATTNETVVYGLGELHLRVLLERLQEVHKFEVDTAPPRIAYRETIGGPAEGHHRHKKQSGGAGQFGEVHLRVEPLPRGKGFEFIDAVKGGVIPGQFIPAVEKGVREVLASGAIAGYPVVDVRVTVFDGKHHSVDSKEIAFATAGRKAFLAAVRAARPIVLEPSRRHRSGVARRPGRRHHRRPGGQARHGHRHRQWRRRHDAGARQGAAGRTRRLPDATERADQRPGPLHDRLLALRGGAAEHAGAAGRRPQGAGRRLIGQ